MFMENQQIVQNLRLLCKENQESISAVLSNCDITKSFIYDLEKRNQSPSVDKLVRLAQYFNVSVDYLLGRTNIKDVNIGNDQDTST